LSTSIIPDFILIYCSISGICAAIQLKEQLGLTSFFVYEKEPEIGGKTKETKKKKKKKKKDSKYNKLKTI